MSATGFSYCIDEYDRLVQASDGYFRFAEENRWSGAPESIGESLWEFISGTTMQNVQRSLLRRVRETGHAVELPFRCDSPQTRREMAIGIEPQSVPAGGVCFSAQIIAERSRPPQTLLDPDLPRGAELVEMCGWCDRFAVGGKWLEVEEAAAELGLTTTSTLPTISHGICTACSDMLLAA